MGKRVEEQDAKFYGLPNPDQEQYFIDNGNRY